MKKMIYEKNLTNTVRLRLSDEQFAFCTELSDRRAQSVSSVIRSIIDEYKRSLETVTTLQKALETLKQAESLKLAEMEVSCPNGDTKTDE